MEIALALIAGLALWALAVRLLSDRQPAGLIDEQAVAKIRAGLDRLTEAHAGAMGEFRGQLGSIAQAQRSVVQSTGALSAALRRPGVRGRWGEVTLQNVCEAAGLSQHVDFDIQVHLRGEGDDPDARPDLVVSLPDGGALPVDAKVSLDAYLDAAEADTEAEREAHLERHLSHVRAKVRELGSRAYHGRFRRAPEMVVMFVASEAAYSAAVERDPNLLLEAAEKKVVIATPAAMVALLQVTAMGWREAAYAESTHRDEGARDPARPAARSAGAAPQPDGARVGLGRGGPRRGAKSIESRLLVTGRELGRLGIAGAQELEYPDGSSGPCASCPRTAQSIPGARPPQSGWSGRTEAASIGRGHGGSASVDHLGQPALRTGTRGRSAYSR